MASHANSDDGNGRLRDSMISFLKAKTAPMVKSIRSRSQDARRNRKDDHSDSCPPPISMTTTPSAVASSEEQPTATTLVVPNLLGTTISDIAPPTRRIAEKSSMADGTVPLLLREGVKMTKISPGKQRSYVFKLDPDQGQIIWQSKKLRIIPIENIKELRFSSDARYYRQQFQLAQDYEDRWITIIYILNGAYKTLHLISSTKDVFCMWHITLRKLYAIRQELMTGLGNEEIRRAIWEKQYWTASDESSDQKLRFDEVEKLCRRLNVNTSTEELKRLFKQADTKCQSFLNFSDFQRFVKLLKARPDITLLYRKLCYSNDGQFDFSVFEHFLRDTQKSTLSRPELLELFTHYAQKSDGSPDISPPHSPSSLEGPASPPARLLSPPLSTSPPSDTVLSQSLTAPIDVSLDYISHKLSASSQSPRPVMSLDGFTSFLLSSDNSAFIERQGKVCHDMTHPLSEYLISSSHNTYLIGHQLVGSSTIEGYIRALLHSCRSVEIDVYDGDSEPMIFHGKTFTSKVPVREVCEAIAKYAFVTSPYPVIISAEIHCSVLQQEMMVEVMRDVFQDALISAPVEGRPTLEVLPSPEHLKGKVLLKAKNLYVSENESIRTKEVTIDTESSSTETSTDSDVVQDIRDERITLRVLERDAINEVKDELKKARSLFDRVRSGHSRNLSGVAALAVPTVTSMATSEPPARPELRDVSKVKMSFAVASLLVYTVGVKCRGINKKEHYAPEHMFSLSEKTANKVMKQGMVDLIKHNRTHLVRIYPKGLRVNSSNYLPHRYWAAGAQLVAINWQTFDLGYMINHAMFQRNGRAGYVLKPLALRIHDKELLSRHTQHSLDIVVISAQQLPRPKDSLGHEIMDKSTVDPYVEVSIHVPDWPHASYHSSSSSTTPSPSSTGSTGRLLSRRTNSVKNNGFNPVWQEVLSLPFDCVGDMFDLIFVRFAVRRDGDNDEEPIAVYCVSLGSLAMGYRHLPLHDTQLSQYLFSTLFVMCAIN
ncbi:1-phosphatidylinositol-4,5-bisphosphate phosphodiesterase 1 [Suillus fuscotomentosus]|uniref:Phosphoinositide phospholipase C n=1 Tax=Suillus fuscotomentosus TaxID=1912939 RepID=A0AAD4E1R9_9AGAM|nr:1-phosphatidylinositol-4,5-bisphosphate phosphodiesterase 1 [Suillus fuscotomentosus]KAG1897646.1 1-phosphatidylinositol-4,5-bisphosphate phosphodiesterase 1 [Suillus fuscotomentosus]